MSYTEAELKEFTNDKLAEIGEQVGADIKVRDTTDVRIAKILARNATPVDADGDGETDAHVVPVAPKGDSDGGDATQEPSTPQGDTVPAEPPLDPSTPNEGAEAKAAAEEAAKLKAEEEAKAKAAAEAEAKAKAESEANAKAEAEQKAKEEAEKAAAAEAAAAAPVVPAHVTAPVETTDEDDEDVDPLTLPRGLEVGDARLTAIAIELAGKPTGEVSLGFSFVPQAKVKGMEKLIKGYNAYLTRGGVVFQLCKAK